MTEWGIRVAAVSVTLVVGIVGAAVSSDRLGACLLAASAGAAGMRLLYLFDPTVNR